MLESSQTGWLSMQKKGFILFRAGVPNLFQTVGSSGNLAQEVCWHIHKIAATEGGANHKT